MTNDSSWYLCWHDPVCVSCVVAGTVAIISFGRRLGACDAYLRTLDYSECFSRSERRTARKWSAFQYVVSGSIVCGGAAFGLALTGAEQWPQQIKSVAGLVVVGSVAVDFSGPLFAKFLRTLATAYMRASSQAEDRPIRVRLPDEHGDDTPKSD